jgi:hypothetical protein
MVGIGDGAMVQRAGESRPAAHSINWLLAALMMTILIAAVAGVTVALISGMPTLALVIALVTGAIFAGVAC